MTKILVRANQNIWGNWIVYVGGKRFKELGESRFDTLMALSELLYDDKYKLAMATDISHNDIKAFRESLN